MNHSGMNLVHSTEPIDDAMSLLYYAARTGIVVESEIKSNIARFEGTRIEDLAEEDRLAFWNAFTALADKLKPVTPASIKYTNDVGVRGISRRSFQVPFYVVISSLALLLLVCVQLFWVGGTALVTDVKLSLDRVRSIQAAIIEKEIALSTAVLTTPEIDKHYVELRFSFARLTSDLESLHAWNLLWSKIPFMHPPFKSATYLQFDMADAC